jgi:hypothetical protein
MCAAPGGPKQAFIQGPPRRLFATHGGLAKFPYPSAEGLS